jgi:ubiquinone/menaquinone biosynthesis C-methylase UbiE/uncharacterized protein YbaR (Trm112 family)
MYTKFKNIFVCPKCKKPMQLNIDYNSTKEQSIACEKCLDVFHFENGTLNLIPNSDFHDEMWSTWNELQGNGLAAYINDPTNNLSVGERKIAKKFSSFCNLKGLVLDVGCGRQEWPTYFYNHDVDTTFIGIDPLINKRNDKYLQIKALAEYLPFKNKIFDNILFAGSLDHFVSPGKSLMEAIRVLKEDGEVNILIGTKKKALEKKDNNIQPEWYLKLKKPSKANDLFHFEKWNLDKTIKLIKENNYTILDIDKYVLDEIRIAYFIKCKYTQRVLYSRGS